MNIKSKILKKFENFLYKNIETISEGEIEIALYGMEVIYSLTTKTLLLFLISIFLKCQMEFLIVSLLFAIIRASSFGFHADKEINCYIVSFATVFGTIYIAQNFNFNILFTAIICLLSILAVALFAPADTEKRPLLNDRIRTILKLCSMITAIFFSFIAIINVGFMSNAITCILLINSINISPILYKIFKRRYKNYEYYQKELSN